MARTPSPPNSTSEHVEQFAIRLARPEDAPHICRLLREIDTIHQPFDRLQIRQVEPTLVDAARIANLISTDDHVVQVAERDQTVIGYVRMSIHQSDGNRLFVPLKVITVHDLIVTHSSRGQGVGKALMQTVDEVAAQTAAQRIRLDYYADNVGARQFYERLGFRPLRHTVVRDPEIGDSSNRDDA